MLSHADQLKLFTELIECAKPFSVVRFNDGELECAQGREGGNCDVHPYSPELAQKLRDSLDVFFSRDNVFMPNPMQGPAEEIVGNPFTSLSHYDFIRDMRLLWQPYAEKYPEYNGFIDHIGLHHRAGHLIPELREFVIALQKKDSFKIYVGPERMEKLNDFIDSNYYIDIPEQNCFSEYDNTLERIKNVLIDGCIVVFTAGMMAKPLIAECIKYNPTGTYLDFGSSFDPMFYGQTRTGQPTMDEIKSFYDL